MNGILWCDLFDLFTWYNVLEVRPYYSTCQQSIPFYNWTILHCVFRSQLFSHTSIDGHLGSFHLVNSTAVRMCVSYLCVYFLPSCGVRRSTVVNLCSAFLGIAKSSWWTILNSHQQCVRDLLLCISAIFLCSTCSYFLLFLFFLYPPSMDMKWNLIVSRFWFVFQHWLLSNFCVLLYICIFSVKKCIFKIPLPIFGFGYLFVVKL